MRQVLVSAVSAGFVLGLALTFWGLFQMEKPLELFFTQQVLIYRVPLYVVGLLAFLFVARAFNVGLFGIFAVLTGLSALAIDAVWPILVTGWFALAAVLVGRLVLSIFRIEPQTNQLLFEFLVGAGVYGTVVGVLAHFPVNYPGVYAVALLIPVVANRRRAVDLARDLVSSFSKASINDWQELLIALLVLVYLMAAFMPEVGHDALAMHLFVPAHLLLRHEWGFDVGTYVWAVMPMLGDWLYATVYMLAGESSSRLLNVGFIFVLAWLVRDIVLWAGGTAKGAKWAVLIYLTTPLTFTEGSSLFIESIWASYVVAGTLAVLRASSTDGNRRNQLAIAGVFLGCALAAKAVTFTILPILFLMLVWRYKSWLGMESARSLIIGFSLFLIVGAYPYIVAWSITGNPVFPFFNQLFESPFYPSVNFDGAAFFGKGLSWDVLYQVIFDSGRYLEGKPGAAGFQWLLLFVPASLGLLLGWHRRGLAILFIALLAVELAFMSVSYLRYVFPSFVLVAACIGIALSEFLSGGALLRRAGYLAGGLTIGLNFLFLKSGTHYGELLFKPLMSSVDREQYLHSRLPIRNAVELINTINKGKTPVAVFSSPLMAGLSANALYPNWYNHDFDTLIKTADKESDIAEVLVREGVNYVIIDSNWGDADKRRLIENVTTSLVELNAISVRQLLADYQFQSELLDDPAFRSESGWTLAANAERQESGGVLVSVESPAYQTVPVVPERRYKNVAIARCHEQSAQGRLQVNWLDSKHVFISTDIQVFDCEASATQYSMELGSPGGAAFAFVYATGHTTTPLVFNNMSFRQ